MASRRNNWPCHAALRPRPGRAILSGPGPAGPTSIWTLVIGSTFIRVLERYQERLRKNGGKLVLAGVQVDVVTINWRERAILLGGVQVGCGAYPASGGPGVV